MKLRTFGLLTPLLVVAPGCATTGWLEVKTAHATVKTDLSPEDASRAAVLTEQTRTALLAAAWPGSELEPDRIELVVFANHQEFEHYFGGFSAKLVLDDYRHIAFLYGPPDRWEKRVVLDAEGTTSALKEALVEHLSTFLYRRRPRWFSVGLAEFLETVVLSEDGKTAVLGTVNLQALSLYRFYRTITVEDALAWGVTLTPTDQGTLRGLRGLSWLMVQWMFNTHRAEFVRFQKLLVTGLDPQKAWAVAFPALAPRDLDQELNRFSRYGFEGLATVPIPQASLEVGPPRALSAAEVHVLRAEAALAAEQTKDAQAELSAALALDPGNVAALYREMAQVKPPERLALARTAVAAHPDDCLAWRMLGDALRDAGVESDERVQAYRQAAELAPWDASMLDTLALALAAAGRCTEAIATEGRAVDLALAKGVSAKRTEYASRLLEMEASCVPVPKPTPLKVPPSPPLNEAPPPPELPARKP
jgi:tetratricopeptide (TPR) repeat protein